METKAPAPLEITDTGAFFTDHVPRSPPKFQSSNAGGGGPLIASNSNSLAATPTGNSSSGKPLSLTVMATPKVAGGGSSNKRTLIPIVNSSSRGTSKHHASSSAKTSTTPRGAASLFENLQDVARSMHSLAEDVREYLTILGEWEEKTKDGYWDQHAGGTAGPSSTSASFPPLGAAGPLGSAIIPHLHPAVAAQKRDEGGVSPRNASVSSTGDLRLINFPPVQPTESSDVAALISGEESNTHFGAPTHVASTVSGSYNIQVPSKSISPAGGFTTGGGGGGYNNTNSSANNTPRKNNSGSSFIPAGGSSSREGNNLLVDDIMGGVAPPGGTTVSNNSKGDAPTSPTNIPRNSSSFLSSYSGAPGGGNTSNSLANSPQQTSLLQLALTQQPGGGNVPPPPTPQQFNLLVKDMNQSKLESLCQEMYRAMFQATYGSREFMMNNFSSSSAMTSGRDQQDKKRAAPQWATSSSFKGHTTARRTSSLVKFASHPPPVGMGSPPNRSTSPPAIKAGDTAANPSLASYAQINLSSTAFGTNVVSASYRSAINNNNNNATSTSFNNTLNTNPSFFETNNSSSEGGKRSSSHSLGGGGGYGGGSDWVGSTTASQHRIQAAMAGSHSIAPSLRSDTSARSFEERQGDWREDEETGNETIAQYTVIGELGSGTYGTVSLVEDPEGNLFAVKTTYRGTGLRRPLKKRPSNHITGVGASVSSSAGSGDEISQIDLEIAIMKKLRHKNLVRLYEVIESKEQKTCYLVMQYVQNGNMASIRDDGSCHPTFPLDESLRLMRQVATGLLYLHKHDIAHRDIKPENILLGRGNEQAYLADFGVSAVMSETKQLGAVVGTTAFWSPEKCTSTGTEHEKYSKESDIWALGVTLYAILFGCLPFRGSSRAEMMIAIRDKAVEYPSGTSPELQALINDLLSKKPENRMSLRAFRRHPLVRGQCDEPSFTSLPPPSAATTPPSPRKATLAGPSISNEGGDHDVEVAEGERPEDSPDKPIRMVMDENREEESTKVSRRKSRDDGKEHTSDSEVSPYVPFRGRQNTLAPSLTPADSETEDEERLQRLSMSETTRGPMELSQTARLCSDTLSQSGLDVRPDKKQMVKLSVSEMLIEEGDSFKELEFGEIARAVTRGDVDFRQQKTHMTADTTAVVSKFVGRIRDQCSAKKIREMEQQILTDLEQSHEALFAASKDSSLGNYSFPFGGKDGTNAITTTAGSGRDFTATTESDTLLPMTMMKAPPPTTILSASIPGVNPSASSSFVGGRSVALKRRSIVEPKPVLLTKAYSSGTINK